jgi:hypothetical protein
MNGSIIVDVNMHKGNRAGWDDTGQKQVTLKYIAYIVNGF